MDESTASLVLATGQFVSRGDLEAAAGVTDHLVNHFERVGSLLLLGWDESSGVLIKLRWWPLLNLVLLMWNKVLGTLLLLLLLLLLLHLHLHLLLLMFLILWVKRLLVLRQCRLLFIYLRTNPRQQIITLQIDSFQTLQIPRYHLLNIINFLRIHTRTNITRRILLTHCIMYGHWLLHFGGGN